MEKQKKEKEDRGVKRKNNKVLEETIFHLLEEKIYSENKLDFRTNENERNVRKRTEAVYYQERNNITYFIMRRFYSSME
jgi:hypothetical protein